MGSEARADRSAFDATSQFQVRYRTFSQALAHHRPVDARPGQRFKVLFVLGYHCYVADSYFIEEKRWLSEHQISWENVPIDPNAGSTYNAQIVASAIRGSPLPALFVSYSFGGIDVLQALVEHPELRASVAGWISLASPFRGSSIADVAHRSPLRWAAQALSYLPGNRWEDGALTTEVRTRYLRDHAPAVGEIARQLRILSVAGQNGAADGDGVVSLNSAILPGTASVTVGDANHFTLAGPSRGSFMKVPFFQAALATALALKPAAPRP